MPEDISEELLQIVEGKARGKYSIELRTYVIRQMIGKIRNLQSANEKLAAENERGNCDE